MKLSRVLTSLAVLLVASAAHAAQHQNAFLYVDWQTTYTTQTYTRFEQRLQVTQKAPASFWATMWTWKNSSTGGYIGLQTDGNRVDGSVGDTVIFSIWNATAAKGDCQPFAGEGVGYSCRLAWTINPAHKYRLRIQPAVNAADPAGQWWDAYIRNESTFVETRIGSLRAGPSDTSFLMPSNFSEYFGSQMPTCDGVPVSIAQWSKPTLKPLTGYLNVTPTYKSSFRGDCTGGSAISTSVSFQPIVKVTLGGPR
ncbi:MAG: hypothetical protein WBV82_14030 [Myxococcaceae bacterium]